MTFVLVFERSPSAAVVVQAFGAYAAFVARCGPQERFVTIIDSSLISSVTAAARRAAAQELSRLRAQLQSRVLNHYAVSASPSCAEP